MLYIAEGATITVGKLGAIAFAAGAYAYVGSALGPAGFGRIRRHVGTFSGPSMKRKWHIDYLSSIATLRKVLAITTTKRIECDIAEHLQASPSLTAIKHFGASDCGCNAHLFCSPDTHDLGRELKNVARSFDGQVMCWKLSGV
ncbi:MAG: GIY-YIG nuclease family protein [Halobacteriota archaeon]